MNSEDFFKNDIGNQLKHHQGIYCLEQPLFKKEGKRIFKIGYARDNLYKRIRDYKTAYSVIPFTIHLLWAVPEKVVHKRANFALLTETIIHKSLYQECAMKDEDFIQNGEWFYEIKKIVGTMKNIREGYIFEGVNNADKWMFWINPEYENVAIRKTTRAIATEKDVNSKLKDLNVKDRTDFKRKVTPKSFKEPN
jgi:hypothetical protein